MRTSVRINQRISQKTVTLIICIACTLAGLFLLILLAGTSNSYDAMGAAGKQGNVTIGTPVIVNEYTTLSSNASAGAFSIAVASSSLNTNNRFSAALSSGDLIMIIQMQGATVSVTNANSYGSVSNYNNCGKYEFAEVASVPNATTIALTSGLKNNYTSSGRTQVIRVPRYGTLTVTAEGSITCPSWNGTTGGVIAIESNGSTVLNGSINASGKGFRGGATEQNTQTPGEHSDYASTSSSDGAEKGEGIGGPASGLSTGRYGRGAPGNGGGGGNSHNAGGGGGANAGSGTWNGGGIPLNLNSNWTTAWNLEGGNFSSNNSPGGGRGGYTWSSAWINPITEGINNSSWSGDNRCNAGGFGGRPLDYSGNRIYMGGGGGAGDSNNGVGTAGGNGGGIVLIISAGLVSGTGYIYANGADVPLSSGVPGDASGGGGGGGTVIIYTSGAWVSNITINANGGTGGSQNLSNDAEVEGPGGGGGGGYICTTNNLNLSLTVNGGSNGITNAPPVTAFAANGATSGAPGLIALMPLNPYSGTTTLPVELLSFTGRQSSGHVLLEWNTSSEKSNDYFTIERSSDGNIYNEIARVKGAGTTSNGRFYKHWDENPLKVNYYRLSQTDFNGKRESFRPICVKFQTTADEKVFFGNVHPNPFEKEISIEYFISHPQVILIRMVSISGKQLAERKVFAEEGYNSLIWDIDESVSEGIYYLYIYSDSGKSAVVKVIRS